MENDRIRPKQEFIYLQNVETEMTSIEENQKYEVEQLDWAENIGRSYLKLSFDRSKR